MCMVEYAESYGYRHIRHARPTARKAHKCDECGRTIAPPEIYRLHVFVEEGRFDRSITCAHCGVAQDWLSAECGGYLYHGVADDIQEHVEERHYGLDLARLAIGIKRQWRRLRSDSLMPVPALPKVERRERVA